MSVIEVMTFRLAPAVDETAFLEADSRVQQEFAYQQSGLMRRTAARGDDGTWVVIDLWRSAADADACAERWDQDTVASAFMSFLDPATVRTNRFSALD